MEWNELVRALALVMIIEGLMPFAVPDRWRVFLQQVSQLDARVLRSIGLLSISAGVIILQLT